MVTCMIGVGELQRGTTLQVAQRWHGEDAGPHAMRLVALSPPPTLAECCARILATLPVCNLDGLSLFLSPPPLSSPSLSVDLTEKVVFALRHICYRRIYSTYLQPSESELVASWETSCFTP